MIAKDSTNDAMDRIEAIDSLADKALAQKLFSEIINDDADWRARNAAIRYATDRELLKKIAKGGRAYRHEFQYEEFDCDMHRSVRTFTIDLCETARIRLLET
jgi:hypothetical protein